MIRYSYLKKKYIKDIVFHFIQNAATRVQQQPMEGTLQYLKGLQSKLQLESQADTSDELDLLVQNAFQEIDGVEFRLACHHDGSVYVEKLLTLASSFQIRVFWDRLAGCYGRAMSHRYASHVIETLLVRSEHWMGNDPSTSVDNSEELGVLLSLHKMINRFEEEIVEQVFDLMDNTYASHVLRVYVDKFEFSESFCNAFSSDWQTYWTKPTAAPVLQSLFLKKPEIIEDLSLTKKMFLAFTADKIGSRTCEAYLEAACKVSNELYVKAYQSFIRGDTNSLIADKSGNFVVQSLISFCPNESLLLVILDEIAGQFTVKDRMGIIFKVLDWPVRRGRAFEPAMHFFFDSLKLKTPSERQSAVTLLKDSKLGLSILSLFPKYPSEHCKHIVDGFLDLEPSELSRLATDRTAAHTIESFISATNNIGAKARNRIIRKLVPFSADLAIDSSGSFVIETAFKAASIDIKMAIAANLASSRKRLEESKFGKFILRKCAIEDFERRQDEWKKARMSVDSKRSLLDDIIGGGDDNDNNNKKQARLGKKKVKSHHN